MTFFTTINLVFDYIGKPNPIEFPNPLTWFDEDKLHPNSKKCGTAGCCKCVSEFKNMRYRSNRLPPRRHGCAKCGCGNPRKVCDHCRACAECKIEDKCGSCQDFEGQVSLEDKKRPCPGCGKKTCQCPRSNGKPVIKEPGAARGGVYSSCLANMVYI